MEKFPPKPMTPLDELVTPPTLYTLKLLLPYMPASTQRTLAVFVKFLNLKERWKFSTASAMQRKVYLPTQY